MSVPALRFPEFEEKWSENQLGDVAPSPSYGLNAAATQFDGVHQYIRITDIDETTRKFLPDPVTSPLGEKPAEYRLELGDLLFARTGAGTGRSYLYSSADGEVYFAGFLIRFKVVGASPEFVFAQTLRRKFDDWIVKTSVRSGQPGINAKEFSRFTFLAPTCPEQEKIAAFLRSVDEKLTALRKKRDLLTEYKRGAMQQIFSQKIRFTRDDGSAFPDWEEVELRELASRCTEKNVQVEHTRVLTNSAVQGIIDQADYFDKDIANVDNLSGYTIVEYGDFVYNPRISVNAPVGPIKQNLKGVGIMSPLYSVFRFFSGTTAFYTQYFETSFWHEYLKSVANYGARHDRMAILTNDLMAMPLPKPHPDEQQIIVDFLSTLDAKIDAVKSQVTQMEAFKNGLLQQMFV